MAKTNSNPKTDRPNSGKGQNRGSQSNPNRSRDGQAFEKKGMVKLPKPKPNK